MAEQSAPARNWPLIVRRARADDQEAVLAFATHTWDRWDYIPNAWPVWLAANDGVLLVAAPGAPGDESQPLDLAGSPLTADRPVAVARVARSAIGEAWLEGIRVDPRVRGMGVATDFQTAELRWAAAFGAQVVRYATSERNEGSLRLGARHGFEPMAAFASWWWSADPDRDPDLPSSFLPDVRAATSRRRQVLLKKMAANGWAAEPADTDALWRALSTDSTFLAGARLYEPRAWALQELTRAAFTHHVQRSEVLVNGSPADDDHTSWALAILLREQLAAEDSSMRLALLAGDGQRALELVEQGGREMPSENIRFRVPLEAPLTAENEAQWLAAGYRLGDFRMHVMGREIGVRALPPIDPRRLILADRPTPLA